MNYSIIFSLLLSINAVAQVKLPTNEVGQVQYQEIVRVPNAKLPARQLMEQARAWANQYYAANLTTEQHLDQTSNILFIKSSYSLNNQLVRYVLTIEPKYGRYRATITELVSEGNSLTVPVLASSTTVVELEKTVGKTSDRKLLEQTANQQANLYKQIDNACRGTLLNLKQELMAK